MARFGEARLATGVMYLGSITADGYPRVHPVTPFVAEGHLFVFMDPRSPKARDLQRVGKFAMHSLVTDANGTGGEFLIMGHAVSQTDATLRRVAVQGCSYVPDEQYLLFEFLVERCLTNQYGEDFAPTMRRWRL